MKKSTVNILMMAAIAAAVITATTAMAQTTPNWLLQLPQEQTASPGAFSTVLPSASAARVPGASGAGVVTRRSYSDGVYYQRPAGAFYQGIDTNWQGMSHTAVIVRPWCDITWQNKCATTAVTWTIAGQPATADAQGDLTRQYQPMPQGLYSEQLPTITNGNKSYTLGEGTEGWDDSHLSMAMVSDVAEMSVYDQRLIVGTSGDVNLLNFRPLSVYNTKYNFGTMTLTNGTATYYVDGVTQLFERPLGPLWVESVVIPAISYSTDYMPADGELTLTFYDYVYNQEGVPMIREAIDTMTCRASDIVFLGRQQLSATTSVAMLSLVFSTPDKAPLTLIDRFCVTIRGFNKQGVDIGLAGAFVDDVDRSTTTGSSLLLQDAQGNDLQTMYNYGSLIPCIGIRGLYDAIRLETQGGGMTLTAPAEGGVATVDGKTDDTQTVDIYTAVPMNASSATLTTSAYTFEGLPEWLSVAVDESERDYIGGASGNAYGHGLTHLTFTAQPLPEGSSSRQAEIYISGRGTRTTTPIIITQEKGYEKGDINRDGEVNTTDVTVLYNVIFGTDTTTDREICNIDDDTNGDVNTTDVTALYNIIFGTGK